MLHQQSLRFVAYTLRAYAGRTASTIGLLLLAGLAEGVGIVALLPLLEVGMGDSAGGESLPAAVIVRLLAVMSLRPTLGILLGLIVLAMALKGAFLWLAMRQVGYSVAQVATDLRLALIRALMRAEWTYFASRPAGHFANALSTEALRASWAYQDACTALARAIQVGIYAAIVFLISWKVALLGLIIGGAVLFALSGFVKQSREAGSQQTAVMKSLIARITELLPGIKPIKAMAREKEVQPLLEQETQSFNEAQRRVILAAENVRFLQEPVVVAVVAFGLYVILTYGTQPVSVVLLLTFLFYRLMTRINLLQSRYQAMTVAESAFWSLREQVDLAEAARESSSAEVKAPPRVEKAIRLDAVCFAYGNKDVLTNCSLEIPAGQFVVITGSSGAGKTTLIDVVAGLLRPQRGEVFVGDVPLHQLHLSAWRKTIGYVPQEISLFHNTIFENVTLGDERFTRQQVEEALDAALAGEFVRGHPKGMNRVIGERGTKLSSGQRQRIAIARAIIGKPQVLILDEPTAALDPQTELSICDTLRRLRGQATIIAVSHQPAMKQIADAVYEVKNGAAVKLAKEQQAHVTAERAM